MAFRTMNQLPEWNF